tara:strand:- start:3229 stop:5457 length:2229 start_codon:yes stop_codon:yes gene_type:complete
MPLLVLVFLAGALFCGSIEVIAAGNHDRNPSEKSPGIRALLIGVTAYPSLPSKYHLRGPSNDVDLLATSLRQRFGVQNERIVQLWESPDSEHLPTRMNIQREFVRLAETANSGDHVVIFMAGHGSQMPNSDELDFEADGLDEVFLPRDIGRWNGRVGRVENAISDDEIHNWIDSIRKTGAFVFFVGDFCHSGTSTRGTGPVSRAIEPAQLGIPTTSVARGSPQRGEATDNSLLAELDSAVVGSSRGDMVALYAAEPHELAYEDSIPRGGERHGWLSWALNQTLNESNGTLTYRQLADRVSWHYQLQRWTRSTPLMEGTGIDHEVFGQKKWPQQLKILLSRTSGSQNDESDYRINAGLLQRITRGSILEVLPPTVNQASNEPVGHVQVVSVEAMSATVVPTNYQNEKTSKKLPTPASCKLVYCELGDKPLHIRVDLSSVADPQRRERLRQSTEDILSKTAKSVRVPITLEDFVESADFVLRVSSDGASIEIIRPSTDSNREEAVSSRKTAEPLPGISLGKHVLSQAPEEWLKERLNQIYRAETLRRLATPMGSSADSGVRLSTEIVIRSARDIQGKLENDPNLSPRKIGQPTTVSAGDEPRITIRNGGFSPVDITALYIAADLSITVLYPDGIQYNRCLPGRQITIGGWRINNATLGWEDVIIVAVRSDRGPIPHNFGFLADPVLASVSRNVRASGGDAFWNSPIIRLCRSTMYRERGLVRGISTSDSRNLAVHRLSWKVVPQ